MSPWRRPLLVGAAVAGLLLLACLVAGLLLAIQVARHLPRLPDSYEELSVRPGTEIFASTGEHIFSFNATRRWAPLAQISPAAVQALLATEDEGFYDHAGVDISAIVAALWTNVTEGYGRRGGSTLTQQLIKRMFFSSQKSIRRKAAEMLLALQLEALMARTFPGTELGPLGEAPVYKNRLLELYLNSVFYGASAYGIADAAYTFFGITPAELDVPRAALLMGLINAPTAYNPLHRPERATERLRHVLRRMRAAGYLSQAEEERYAALDARKLLAPQQAPQNPAPYWAEAIKAEVARRWGEDVLRYGALRIYTTLDPRYQREAERAVQAGLAALDERLGFRPFETASPDQRSRYVQAALVCLAPHTGQVRAMVGGRDIFTSYYNRALTARRQPGSGFKPVAYLAALESGAITPLTRFVDEPRRYVVQGQVWTPANYRNQYMGTVTAAWALARSANSVAVQITQKTGPKRVAAMARRLGFSGRMGAHMSIALGVNEVTVLEMASAYGAFVTAGLHVEPTLVDSVLDASGRRLFAHAPEIHQVVAPELAYELLQMLRLVVDYGTGYSIRRAGMKGPVAGKTGTTNDNTDIWFTGCTPELVTSVWVGFDDRRSLGLVDRAGRELTGGSGAAPIWADFMMAVTPEDAAAEFPRPPGIRLVTVDAFSGQPVAAEAASGRRLIQVALAYGQGPSAAGAGEHKPQPGSAAR